jgi:hypothetical protein
VCPHDEDEVGDDLEEKASQKVSDDF